MGGCPDAGIFELLIGDVEGKLEHSEDEGAMGATVVNKS